MMRNRSSLCILTVLAVLASSAACATIVRRKTQRIPLIPGVIPAFAWKLDHDESLLASTSLLIWGAGAAAVGGILTALDCGGPGKGYELRPTELTVTLTKTDGTPHVDTIFVDPDDFKNIIWIRVRS